MSLESPPGLFIIVSVCLNKRQVSPQTVKNRQWRLLPTLLRDRDRQSCTRTSTRNRFCPSRNDTCSLSSRERSTTSKHSGLRGPEGVNASKKMRGKRNRQRTQPSLYPRFTPFPPRETNGAPESSRPFDLDLGAPSYLAVNLGSEVESLPSGCSRGLRWAGVREEWRREHVLGDRHGLGAERGMGTEQVKGGGTASGDPSQGTRGPSGVRGLIHAESASAAVQDDVHLHTRRRMDVRAGREIRIVAEKKLVEFGRIGQSRGSARSRSLLCFVASCSRA